MKWWLSFCDGHLPKGSQFLGACIVEGDDVAEAAREAWARGCNPGGEVMGGPIDPRIEVPWKWTNRLLTRKECEQFDAEFAA